MRWGEFSLRVNIVAAQIVIGARRLDLVKNGYGKVLMADLDTVE
jgi:hypothetical protein